MSASVTASSGPAVHSDMCASSARFPANVWPHRRHSRSCAGRPPRLRVRNAERIRPASARISLASISAWHFAQRTAEFYQVLFDLHRCLDLRLPKKAPRRHHGPRPRLFNAPIGVQACQNALQAFTSRPRPCLRRNASGAFCFAQTSSVGIVARHRA